MVDHDWFHDFRDDFHRKVCVVTPAIDIDHMSHLLECFPKGDDDLQTSFRQFIKHLVLDDAQCAMSLCQRSLCIGRGVAVEFCLQLHNQNSLLGQRHQSCC